MRQPCAFASCPAIEPTAALVINFPRIAQGGGFGGFGGFGGPQLDFNQAVRRRDEAVEDLKKQFAAALAHGKAMDAVAKDKSLPFVATNLAYEAMLPYVRGEKPIIFTAERERDIRAVAKFVAEMAGEKGEELAYVARIGLARFLGRRPLVAQMRQPRIHGAVEVGAEGKARTVEACFGHGRSLAELRAIGRP